MWHNVLAEVKKGGNNADHLPYNSEQWKDIDGVVAVITLRSKDEMKDYDYDDVETTDTSGDGIQEQWQDDNGTHWCRMDAGNTYRWDGYQWLKL